MAAMGKTPSNTAVIGDQIFTDIFGGKRLGLYAVLVVPIDEKEFITTRLVRKMERAFLERLVRQGKLKKPVVKSQL